MKREWILTGILIALAVFFCVTLVQATQAPSEGVLVAGATWQHVKVDNTGQPIATVQITDIDGDIITFGIRIDGSVNWIHAFMTKDEFLKVFVASGDYGKIN